VTFCGAFAVAYWGCECWFRLIASFVVAAYCADTVYHLVRR
jgi:hypothetical protein